jgi:hypothetical protein
VCIVGDGEIEDQEPTVTPPVEFRREAETEFLESFAYYEEQAPGLGRDFERGRCGSR